MHENEAVTNGGAVAITSTEGLNLTVINNTWTLNSPDAFNNNSNGLLNIYNTIIWNNGVTQITGPQLPNVFNSIVQGGYIGVNIKDMDPLFIDPASNFRLTSSSPAIDMGDNAVVTDTTDLDVYKRQII